MRNLTRHIPVTLLAGALLVALAIVPARAQAINRLSVTIPFDFMVGDIQLKAGDYNIEVLEPGLLAFDGVDGQRKGVAFATATESANHGRNAHLVFQRYGTDSFLTQVFLSGDNDCSELLRSRLEKKLIKSFGAGDEVAVLIMPAR